MKKYIIINGPNLNLLGKREPEVYGNKCFEDFLITLKAKNPQISIEYYQSNIEGEIVNKIHTAIDSDIVGLIINPAAYTHYSIAISDALEMLTIPKVEVHLTNIYKREKFRHTSMTAKNCDTVISGASNYGYFLASEYIKQRVQS